nr:hypothetical protein [Tanacetum cinerariifolium]
VLLKLILSVHRIRRRRYNLIPAESKFKNLVLDHQDKYMMKAQHPSERARYAVSAGALSPQKQRQNYTELEQEQSKLGAPPLPPHCLVLLIHEVARPEPNIPLRANLGVLQLTVVKSLFGLPSWADFLNNLGRSWPVNFWLGLGRRGKLRVYRELVVGNGERLQGNGCGGGGKIEIEINSSFKFVTGVKVWVIVTISP